MPKRKDITGQRFGMLTAIRPTEERVGGSVVWEFRCDCGSVVRKPFHNAESLYSCGCEKPMRRPFRDLTGQRFGMLTAIEPTGKRKHRTVVWRCFCDCGNEIEVPSWSLVDGQRTSCGCKRKERLKNDAKKLLVDGSKPCLISEKPREDNATGIRGVVLDRRNGKFIAQLQFRGKRYRLGTFKELADAANARREAEETILDPWLEEHGYPKTSEDEFRANLAAALEKCENGGRDD